MDAEMTGLVWAGYRPRGGRETSPKWECLECGEALAPLICRQGPESGSLHLV